MIKGILLWANASPSSTFAAQSKSISGVSTSYNWFAVIHKLYYNDEGLGTRIAFIQNGTTGVLEAIYAGTTDASNDGAGYRTCSISQSGTTVTATFGTANYNKSDNNNAMIPLYIFGIEGVSLIE